MSRLPLRLWALASCRVVTPLVVLCFLLLYIGIAFFSPEPLTSLMAVTRSSPLALLLALIPLNAAARLVAHARGSLQRRALRRGGENISPEPLFDETVNIPSRAPFDAVRDRLHAAGYRSRRGDGVLVVWRGVSLSPARLLLLAATCTLFAGILVSTTLRGSRRVTVIEGEPFLQEAGGGRVTEIALRDYPGIVLDRTLAIRVAEGRGGERTFGLYPPGRFAGAFVYPRYLGIAPLIRFSAPDFPGDFESFYTLSIYPAGKEDSAEIPGSPYRIVFSMSPPEEGDEPFRTGRMTLLFRIMKGEQLVAAGSLPRGGSFQREGVHLSFPDFRRMVTVDLIRDNGVFLIWLATALFSAAVLFWLPVRLLFPRREMLFVTRDGEILACSRAEGGRLRHGGEFHEALDLLAVENCPMEKPHAPDHR